MTETDQPPPEFLLHGRSLQAWLDWLTTDQATGESTAHLQVPCSRYGRNGGECAPWALAAEAVYVEANGSDDDPEAALDHLMGLAVNDHDDILNLVRNHWYAVPEALRPYLDYDENGLNMAQQAALTALCGRYGRDFNSEHYAPRFDLPDGYVAGWIGGDETTIFVGCDLEGRISS